MLMSSTTTSASRRRCFVTSVRTLTEIPAATPYLAAEPERIARWQKKIGAKGFRIGGANPKVGTTCINDLTNYGRKG